MKLKITAAIAAAAVCAAMLCSCGAKNLPEGESASVEDGQSPTGYTIIFSPDDSGEGASSADYVEPVVNFDAEPIKPAETIKPEDVQPEDDFLGAYSANGYSAAVEAAEDEKIRITVTSDRDGLTAFERSITGYCSETTRGGNYSGAVKSRVTYDKNGAEKSRETVYDNGAGRIEFSENGFVWRNSMEPLDGNVSFEKS